MEVTAETTVEITAEATRNSPGTGQYENARSKDEMLSGPIVVQTLRQLAEQVREYQELDRDVALRLDGHDFVLCFSQNLCLTSGALSCLDRCREHNQQIRVTPLEKGKVSADLKARPLPEFLWRLGIQAGAGRVLPWLSSGAAYLLTNEPGSKASGKFETLLASIRERGLPPLMIAQETQLSLPVIFDFLNACSMEGCLKIVAPPKPEAENNPLYELTMQGPLAEVGPEVEPQQRGLLNLLGALNRLSGE